MARPALNINARFSDVKPIWEYALANDGTMWHCKSTNDAIRVVMRLNTYRRMLRDNTPDGYIVEDLYIVSKFGSTIVIKRRPIVEGYATTLDGQVIDITRAPQPAVATPDVSDQLDIETS